MDHNASNSNATDDSSMDFESFVAAGPAHPVIFGRPKDDEYYRAYPNRGKCIILNHKVFKPTDDKKELNPREATEYDVERLTRTFSALKFEVISYNDLTASAVKKVLKKVSKEDHSGSMCFVCCILTHGSNGELWAADELYSFESVVELFHGDICLSLAGKPKLFFIQACLGDKSDFGQKISFKHSPDSGFGETKRLATSRIPKVSDFLFGFGAFEGFLSYRSQEYGSYYIKELCQAIDTYSKEKDLVQILTKVNGRMSKFSSNNPGNPSKHRKKQATSFYSSLTKFLRF